MENGKLIGIQDVIDIIALTLQSAFLENEKNGVSLILIGKPETAKTSSIFRFQNLDFVSYYDEITQKKLIDEFLPLVKMEQKRTLLIPDLINCIEKQRSTRDQFLNIIKSGIDDTGIISISTAYKSLYYHEIAEGLKFNLVTAITKGSYKNIEGFMNRTGLASRFIPFSYDYPLSLISQIFRMIEGEKITGDVEIPEIQKKKVSIPENPLLFKNFELIAAKISEKYSGFGIRALISLQRLAKANAAINQREEILQEDIDKVIYLSNWFNIEFNSVSAGK